MTTTTTTNDILANVPHPAGATQVDDWADVHGPEHATRFSPAAHGALPATAPLRRIGSD